MNPKDKKFQVIYDYKTRISMVLILGKKYLRTLIKMKILMIKVYYSPLMMFNHLYLLKIINIHITSILKMIYYLLMLLIN